MEKITLTNPIMINGQERREFPYDCDSITITQFSAAEAAAKRKTQSALAMSEFDYTFQFYLGAEAIIAADETIDIHDIERIHGQDLMKVMRVGRFFTIESDESDTNSLDEPSGTLPEPTTHQSQTSTDQPSTNS